MTVVHYICFINSLVSKSTPKFSLAMCLTLLYILKTVFFGYYTFRILYWEIFEMYLECHLCALHHSAMKNQLWKYEMWHIYNSGSSGRGLFCDTRWSCRHTSIMEEPAAPVFRCKIPFISYNFMCHPISSPCHQYQLLLLHFCHHHSSVYQHIMLQRIFTAFGLNCTHWHYANTRRLVLPQFRSAQKSARLKYSWDL